MLKHTKRIFSDFLKRREVLTYGFLLVLTYITIALLLPEEGFKGDLWCWHHWSDFSFKYGFENIYQSKTNYHPIWLYGLYIYGLIQGSSEEIVQNINSIKLVSLVFDFLGAIAIFYFIKFRPKNYLLPFFLILNVAYLYNSIFWGQIDSIPTFFALMAIVFALKNKPSLSILFFVIAINTKLQVIIFIPILGLLLLPQLIQQPKKIGYGLLTIIVTQIIIILPFLWAGTAGEYWHVITNAVGHFSRISMNAFNLWFLIYQSPEYTNDDVILWQLTPRIWGFILFFSFSFIVLFPLLVKAIQQIKSKLVSTDHLSELAFLSSGLVTIVFFYFNTQMHERYAHSALIFFFLYGLKSNSYWLYGLTSLAYFLNMEKLLNAIPFLHPQTFIFEQKLIAAIYLIVLIIGIWKLYKLHRLPPLGLQENS